MNSTDPKIPLSVAIITKNEAENLPDCIRSVVFAEQIVIVDSNSTDDTPAIATAYGCDFYNKPWRGFGPQKQSAIDHCRNPWILVLDADERIPSMTASAIRDIVLTSPSTIAGCSFPRKNYFQGRWIRHAGWWPDRIIRLFRKERGRMSPARVHEGIELDGPVKALDHPIEHYTEGRLNRIIQKIDHYSTLGAMEAYEEGKRATIWGAFFRAEATFVQDYFLRLGMLDGVQGLTLAMTDAVNKFFKYAKLSELGQSNKRGNRR